MKKATRYVFGVLKLSGWFVVFFIFAVFVFVCGLPFHLLHRVTDWISNIVACVEAALDRSAERVARDLHRTYLMLSKNLDDIF